MVAETYPLRAPVDAAVSERESFQDLYLAEFRHLSGYCAMLVSDDQLGYEMAQESFTRLFARWLKVRDPQAYVFLIATNLVRDHWRRRDRERVAMRSVRVVTPTSAPPVDGWLRDVVERLPAQLRDVVLLHYYADLPIGQVAQAMRRPEGTVKRQLHEARRLLLVALEDRHDQS
ncbi:MAG TPA: RNA polymerase sigma factor [Mycobacteriales bacterium]|nr:RNA polymerase sigma factor [Mycobacteriales bacterium]